MIKIDFTGAGQYWLSCPERTNDNRGVASVFPNTGGGALGARIDYSTPLGANGIAARDLDGDGHTDVVATIDLNGSSGMHVLYGGCL